MKKIDLGHTISILANVGVIAGIVFLAVELRQNNELMAADSRAALSDRLRHVAEVVFTDAGLADILVKARNGDTLSESEETRVLSFNVWRLRGLEANFREFQAGAIESNPVDAWRQNFHADRWDAPPMSESWSRAKYYLGEEFVQFMEENVVDER